MRSAAVRAAELLPSGLPPGASLGGPGKKRAKYGEKPRGTATI